MARGFRWAVYVDDIGSGWALKVDGDQVLDPARGWATDGVEGFAVLARGWLPRRVVGLDDEGRTQHTRVGSTDADLWTGAVGTFSFEANDGTTRVATVIAREGERRAFARPPL
jgi:hypothetical protein